MNGNPANGYSPLVTPKDNHPKRSTELQRPTLVNRNKILKPRESFFNVLEYEFRKPKPDNIIEG